MIFNQGHSIKIAQDRCLDKRHHATECNHCIKSCPSNAIFKEEIEKITLDEDCCSGCGLCFNNCPTEVFHSEHWDEKTIFATIDDKAWKVTAFFCGRHTAPFQGEKAEGRGAIRVPACLSAISRGAWYEIGLKTKIELHMGVCDDCSIKEVIDRLNYNLSVALEWLEASGHSTEISIITENPRGKKEKKLLAIDSGLKVTSRREFFLSMFAGGKAKEEIKTILGTNCRNHYIHGRDESLLPSWQKRFAQIYVKNAVEGHGQPAYWPSLRKSADCVNCGLCSRLCPTKTLQVVLDGDRYTHYFTSGLCIDCRVCQLFCLKEAITRERERMEKPFELTELSIVSVGNCKLCGGVTTVNTDKFCYWCNEENNKEQSFMDNCKKIFFKTGI